MIVQVKVKEGDRQRLQAFEGVVIAKRNRGLNSAFTVRKISNGVGVERTFQTYSPIVDSLSVKRRGDVRKAKLYYLRALSGKAARIKENWSNPVLREKQPEGCFFHVWRSPFRRRFLLPTAAHNQYNIRGTQAATPSGIRGMTPESKKSCVAPSFPKPV